MMLTVVKLKRNFTLKKKDEKLLNENNTEDLNSLMRTINEKFSLITSIHDDYVSVSHSAKDTTTLTLQGYFYNWILISGGTFNCLLSIESLFELC